MNVLFLFESVLPDSFHAQTLSPGELRVIAAQESVGKVIAIGRKGDSFYDVPVSKEILTSIEEKIQLVHFNWMNNVAGYYLSGIGLLIHGLRICRKKNISIIHAESPHISGIAAVLLGKLLGIKVIIEYRVSYQNLIRFRYRGVMQKIILVYFWCLSNLVFKLADAVAANTKTYEMELKKTYGLKRIFHYSPGLRKPKVGVSRGKYVGYMGRLYPEKGPLDFLKMIYLGRSWFRRNKIAFLMAGEGPLKNNCEAFIHEHKIDDLVEMVGTVERWKFLSRLRLFVNTTTIANALEMTNAEAAAMGVPVVAYGKRGYPETVVDGKTGELVPPSNVLLLLNKVKSLVKNKLLLSRMAVASLEHAKYYTFEEQGRLLGEAYAGLKL